ALESLAPRIRTLGDVEDAVVGKAVEDRVHVVPLEAGAEPLHRGEVPLVHAVDHDTPPSPLMRQDQRARRREHAAHAVHERELGAGYLTRAALAALLAHR